MFFNQTGEIGLIIINLTQYTTGSIYLTMLLIFIGVLFMCALFRIPIEFTAILMLPLAFTMAFYLTDFRIILYIFLIYAAVLFAKHFFIGR